MTFFIKIECLIVQLPEVLTRNFKNKTANPYLFHFCCHIDFAAHVRIPITVAPCFFQALGLYELSHIFPIHAPRGKASGLKIL